MLSQDQWGTIRTLFERGVPKKAIARQLGVSVPTVRRYLRQGGRVPYSRPKPVFDLLEQDHGEFLRRRAPEVDWVAQVLFQDLKARGFAGCYEVVKRWIRPLREERRRLEAATIRFETGPGKQAQVDWGSTRVQIAGDWIRAHVFVLTLGFSRRMFARAYANERLPSLLDAHERAFGHFGGRTEDLLYDNPKTVVLKRDTEGRHVEWNPVFRDFADYYGFRPKLCRPYRARTKGKVESGIKYVKRNALIGRSFLSWDHLNAWLLEWAATIADVRIHGTTHERPTDRFRLETLVPIDSMAPYQLERHPVRSVATDCMVSLDTNRYSVPWRLVGESVEVSVAQHHVRIFHRGALVASHPLCPGRHQILRDPEHFRGIFRNRNDRRPSVAVATALLWSTPMPEVEVRDLAVYESLSAGGAP
jgi:transposase